MKRLIRYFFQGLLYIAPVAVTLYVIVFTFTWLDGLLRNLEVFNREPFSKFSFPGLGLITILLFVTVIGFFGQRLITTPISAFFSRMLEKAPLIKVIYSSVKDLLSAFVGKERKFDKPVLVSLDDTGVLKRLGFITSDDLSDLGIDDKISIYLPSSYGVLGELYIVPKDKIEPIDVNSADVMKFIVSGGVTKVK